MALDGFLQGQLERKAQAVLVVSPVQQVLQVQLV
jgi:hypothetical protein